jgi:hypothetical protein
LQIFLLTATGFNEIITSKKLLREGQYGTLPEHLLQLFEKYSQLTPTVKFFEPDVNEFTSICLYADSKIRKSLSHLPLTLKKESVAV